MRVLGINDEFVGDVSRLNACCFEVRAGDEPLFLKVDGVYNIDFKRVTLICQPEELGRYACGAHRGRHQV